MATTAKTLLDRLLTVEVDLIVTEQVSTKPSLEGPGDLRAAVETLTTDYKRWIVQRAVVLDTDWATFLSSLEADAAPTAAWERAGLIENGRLVAGLDLDRLTDPRPERSSDDLPEIERVAHRALGMCTILAATGRLTDPRVTTVFHRIHGNTVQIRQVSRTSPRTADQLALVRKAIELGTDVILTQTVVQADGDVMVRVDPTIVSGEMRAAADAADAAVEQTLAYWCSLVDLIGIVATTAGTTLGTRGRLGVLFRGGLRQWRASRSGESATTASHRLGPRRTWMLLRTNGADLFSSGGATIESPQNGRVLYARTVIQPDGDALWFIRNDALGDQALLDQHVTRVADWYVSTGSAIASARAHITRMQRAASACLGIISTATMAPVLGWWCIALGTGAAVVAPRLVRSGIGRVFRRRCRIRAW